MKSAAEFNLPKTGNFMKNSRGNLLHFRYSYAGVGLPKSIMFFLHGYSGHVNGPGVTNMINYMSGHGVGVFCIDFEGHGYSDGHRALIFKHQDLIDDLLQFIGIILVDDLEDGSTAGFDSSFDKSQLPQMRKLPFFIMGQSMGGAVVTLSSNYLKDNYPNYVGSVCLAPALSVQKASKFTTELLRYTVVTMMPNGLLPTSLAGGVSDNNNTLKDEDNLLRAELDRWGNEGALGWGREMKWATALMFLDMAKYISKNHNEVHFPFLIIHDPEDKVTHIDGSRNMYNLSKTPEGEKKLIEVPGYLHGLLANHNDEVCDLVLDWIRPRMEKKEKELLLMEKQGVVAIDNTIDTVFTSVTSSMSSERTAVETEVGAGIETAATASD